MSRLDKENQPGGTFFLDKKKRCYFIYKLRRIVCGFPLGV